MSGRLHELGAVASERLSIRISDDGMTAHATVARGERAGARDLDVALDYAGVAFGVDLLAHQRLAEALDDPDFVASDLVIAVGQAVRPSQDASFVPQFEVGPAAGRIREDGSMDFFDRGLLKAVNQGEPLGRVQPMTFGAPGIRVDNATVDVAPPNEVTLQWGPGVELQADGNVIAKRAGVVLYRAQETLDVVDQHVHTGDVNLRSGHLSMEGSLIVLGEVKRMFGVRASGDLEIRGAIEGGSVYAGGSIAVHGGVSGGDGGVVSAGATLTAHHAERATLVCGGHLTVGEAVHCELTAESIDVLRWMRGGVATAELKIVVEQAGSPQGSSDTILIAGVPVDPPVLPAQVIVIQPRRHERASMPVRTSGPPVRFSGMPARNSGAPARTSGPPSRSSGAPNRVSAAPQRSSTIPRTTSAAPGRWSRTPGADGAGLDAEQQRAEAARKAAYRLRAQRLLPVAAIEVLGVAHAGLAIQIGDIRYVVENPMQNVRFSVDVRTGRIHTERARR